jgi:mannobiose 2-epimerase
MKTMNTHLHLLEAITRFYEVSADAAARERINELMLVLSSAVVRKHIGACSNLHARDWTPVLDRRQSFVSYGHDLETGYLLTRACETIRAPAAPLLDLFRAFAGYSLRYGLDKRHGGFYHTGRFNKRANDRSKVWWVQAEALLALLALWKLTGEEVYRAQFSHTLDWIYRHQADWNAGEWHARIDSRGRANGDKAGAWKGPYHAGRALLECLDKLGRPSTSSG